MMAWRRSGDGVVGAECSNRAPRTACSSSDLTADPVASPASFSRPSACFAGNSPNSLVLPRVSHFRAFSRVSRAILPDLLARVSRATLPIAFLLSGSAAWGQASEPANAYLFPAGGQRGTQVAVTVFGENIASVSDFHLRPTKGIEAAKQTRERKVSLTLAPDAALGVVPWRVATTNGGTGSRGFVVGEYPERIEKEPGINARAAEPVELPVTVNGRLHPHGDTDRFSFELRAGQRFYAEVMAARLGGPIDTNIFVGQFGNPPSDVTEKQLDASLTVYGPDGAVVASAEDTFGLDPALGFKAPKSGRYTAEVHHLAHLGQPQFVYRLTLAPGTLVEAVYPAGGRRGTSGGVSLVSPAYHPAGDGDGQVGDLRQTNTVPLRVGDHPELMESEPNDMPAQALAAALPAVLNGRFLTPGDADTYRVSLKKGETWQFDGWVERLGSPTDASLSVSDASGKVLTSNDDGVPGTHDPRLWFAAPADGDYLVQIREAGMSRLGERLVYRLEATPQAPDFEVEAGAEAVDLAPGGSVEITVSVRRLGG
ncbi:MAG: putative subtilase-type serine protease precursor, partial [Armatimonadetes bacterium]|nr:putative subtilase-type serine protease precursor [Armatimonadota bacterium]